MKRQRLPLKRSLEARLSSPRWHQDYGTSESQTASSNSFPEFPNPPLTTATISPPPLLSPQFHQSILSSSNSPLVMPDASVSRNIDSALVTDLCDHSFLEDLGKNEECLEELCTPAGSISESTIWDDFYQKQTTKKKQATLFSFMSIQSSSNAATNRGIQTKSESLTLEPGMTKSSKREKPVPKLSSTKKFNSGKSGSARTCPFCKRIPGTPFTVDAFQYGSIPDCSAYFLTHFHADHYTGLRKSFQHPIYCSQATSNLVQLQLKVSGVYLHPMPLNKPFVIEKVEVTFLEANHCPGSVLILFKLKSGQNYLHTGDFRFSPLMLLYPPLIDLPIHHLYLDTTYCESCHDFPPQEQVIAFAVDKCLNSVQSCPDTLIVCGSYTIGKEKVFLAIADVLGTKICVSRDKKVILDCLEIPVLSGSLTTDYTQSCLHVLPMAKLNLKDLSIYFEEWSTRYSQLLAFKPTGWTHRGKSATLSCISPQTQGAVTIYGIPYSEHSSFDELRRCVEGWKPRKIIPTVNNFSAHKREEMQRTFDKWLSMSKSPVQTKLKM